MLEVNKISVYYGEIQALYDVSIEIHEGEIVSIIGCNGAGKSTLLKTISGLLRPACGSITFNGVDLCKLPPYKITELGISHVREGRRVFPNLTVLENLEISSCTPNAKKVRRESIEKVFQLFPKLKEKKEQLAGTLSGGERQMLAIGMGLMAQPKLLLLDEASLGLSPLVVENLFNSIKEIHKEYGISILMVEQRVLESLELSQRCYVLENGRIVLKGAGCDLLKDEHVREAYLGI